MPMGMQVTAEALTTWRGEPLQFSYPDLCNSAMWCLSRWRLLFYFRRRVRRHSGSAGFECCLGMANDYCRPSPSLGRTGNVFFCLKLLRGTMYYDKPSPVPDRFCTSPMCHQYNVLLPQEPVMRIYTCI